MAKIIPDLPETIFRFNLTSDDVSNVEGEIFGGTQVLNEGSTRDIVLRIANDGYAFSRRELIVLRDFINEMLDT